MWPSIFVIWNCSDYVNEIGSDFSWSHNSHTLNWRKKKLTHDNYSFDSTISFIKKYSVITRFHSDSGLQILNKRLSASSICYQNDFVVFFLLYFASKYRQKFCFIFLFIEFVTFYCLVIPFCATNNSEGNSYFFRCIRDKGFKNFNSIER